MSATAAVVATGVAPSDTELVAGVRAGDDHAFEVLYRRYQRRISVFVRRVVRDDARAEDVTQEAFVSALRRMRATDSEIVFKPWIYEIARNAAIDQWRRSSRAEEVSISHDELLRPGDRARLVGGGAPETSLLQKERVDHLRWAMDELSQTHHRILVMRELEGLSYREIGERLDLTRPAVESTLFRARRRLEREYEEIEAGRRCEAIGQAIARIAEGVESETDLRRLSRHARGCSMCRRRARQMGVEPMRSRRAAARAAALVPLPDFLRRRFSASQATPPSTPDAGTLMTLVPSGAHMGTALAERAAALVAAVAIAGAGGAVLNGVGTPHNAWSTGGDHRGGAPAGHHARVPEVERQGREATGGSAPLRDGRSDRRSRQGTADRPGKARSQEPGDSSRGTAPGLPPVGEIQAPAPPEVRATPPPVDLPPPEAPTVPDSPGLDAPVAPLSLPSASAAAPDAGTDRLGDPSAAAL